MAKGVNRQVLEIHDTGTEFFEKAMFFVKPEYSTMSEKRLSERAGIFMKSVPSVPQTKKTKRKSRVILAAKLTAAAGVGAALTAIIR